MRTISGVIGLLLTSMIIQFVHGFLCELGWSEQVRASARALQPDVTWICRGLLLLVFWLVLIQVWKAVLWALRTVRTTLKEAVQRGVETAHSSNSLPKIDKC